MVLKNRKTEKKLIAMDYYGMQTAGSLRAFK
jgi:hypothetical protein